MMTHDEISRFFSEEEVKRAFQFPDWPAGTEVVCYCRSTDSRDAIEQIAQQRQWKIVKYVHIDELPIAKFYKSGQVMFAKREALEWKIKLQTEILEEEIAALRADGTVKNRDRTHFPRDMWVTY